MIKLKNVSKFYYSKGVIASGFSKVSLEFNIGEFVAITGESGSGKSTLLNVISGLDTYEEGEMYIDGKETGHYSELDFENYRRKYIGNIFQNFNLVNSYTVYQNVELIMLLNGSKSKEIKEKVNELLKKVNLFEYRNTKVSKLSGGQKQRVAIARALAKDTPVIIADEPTGNLDVKAAEEVFKTLSEISKDKLVIIVTHNYEQVADYVTRKITMHDGRVAEDVKIKNTEVQSDSKGNEYKNIRFPSVLRLGFRNAFNIVPKFLLLLFVFLFVIAALGGEYSTMQRQSKIEADTGYSFVFSDTALNRIILNKKDGTAFTDADYKAIKNVDNVKSIAVNDILKDIMLSFTDEKQNIYFSPQLKNMNNFNYDSVDVGRMPEAADEAIAVGNKDSFDIETLSKTGLNSNFYLTADNGLRNECTKTIKIVGIKYTDSYEYDVYISSEYMSYFNRLMTKVYSTETITFLNKEVTSSAGNTSECLVPSNAVKPGEAVVTENYNSLTTDGKAIGKNVTVNLSNIYCNTSKELKIVNIYNSKNYKTFDTLNEYAAAESETFIFISPEDYYSMFPEAPYQISVMTDEYSKSDETASALNALGYKSLAIKGSLSYGMGVRILHMIEVFATSFVAVVLFFISYFVVKLIMRSRNIYFSTVRILGANKRTARNLLTTELLTVSTLAFAIFTAACEIMKQYESSINATLYDIITYLSTGSYAVLFVILTVISLLISLRYASKLFTDSTMNTMREEV